MSKGDKTANIKFIDFNTNAGLLQNAYAQAQIPEAWRNMANPYQAYVGPPPITATINQPTHISIFVNQYYIDRGHLTDANITAVLTHEVGHALGLAHSDPCTGGTSSIMDRDVMKSPTTALTGMQAYDVAEFKQWYGLP